MLIKAVVVHDDGRMEQVEIGQSLREMQALVGDGEQVFVQAISTGNVTYWMDEEVKFKPHSVNVVATAHMLHKLKEEGRMLMPGDYLGGTVVITGAASPTGKTTSIPQAVADALMALEME